MTTQQCIIVSNRLPVSISRHKGELVVTPSTGGLATAMASFGTSHKTLWIGWPGIPSDELSAHDKRTITRALASHNCIPVFLSSAHVDAFYNGYANETLWPLFHYFQSFTRYNDSYWTAYQEVNELFASIVARHAQPGVPIWVHDYHLMLLPQQLRLRLPASTIGFFLHIPFPSYEIFRSLPNRQQLLEGVLGADLIGFHTYEYVRHFLSSVLHILGIENTHGGLVIDARIIAVDAFPIGIDYKKFTSALQSPNTQQALNTLSRRYRNQQVILSLDRLDYSKGIPGRLVAFERLLAAHPEYHQRIVLIIVAVPSRTEVGAYQELRSTVETSISRINGLFGTIDWTPISYQFQNVPFEQVVALYARADIALVTPLRDGMNLVAKEYVASKQDRPGVLVLSEMAGAADELPEALRVNPNDTSAIVTALETALTLSKKDQGARLTAMQKRLVAYTAHDWAADFLEQLQHAKHLQQQTDDKLLTPATEQAVIHASNTAQARLILLDYDGTLRQFVSTPDPAQAAPPAALMQLIKRLAALPDTTLAIISGRSRDALESWFGNTKALLAAEHGAWVKQQGHWKQQQAPFTTHRAAVMTLLDAYVDRTPGARIEQKDFAIVWHYRTVAPELAYARNVRLKHELKHLLGATDIGIYNGAKVIEIKPKNIHKGTVCTNLLADHPADFVLCIGDDYTDEDMFRALPASAHTIKVGLDTTAARYQIASVESVLALLRRLAPRQKQ
jgi:trehalose 6-phosphate synthase/phosphatase